MQFGTNKQIQQNETNESSNAMQTVVVNVSRRCSPIVTVTRIAPPGLSFVCGRERERERDLCPAAVYDIFAFSFIFRPAAFKNDGKNHNRIAPMILTRLRNFFYFLLLDSRHYSTCGSSMSRAFEFVCACVCCRKGCMNINECRNAII